MLWWTICQSMSQYGDVMWQYGESMWHHLTLRIQCHSMTVWHYVTVRRQYVTVWRQYVTVWRQYVTVWRQYCHGVETVLSRCGESTKLRAKRLTFVFKKMACLCKTAKCISRYIMFSFILCHYIFHSLSFEVNHCIVGDNISFICHILITVPHSL